MTTNAQGISSGKGKATASAIATTSSTEAIIVRDKIVDRLKKMPFFKTFTFSTDKSRSIEPNSVPFVGVYFINEDLSPDGDANHGETRFRSMAMYGISIIVQNNDAKAAEYTLDQAWHTMSTGLFTDTTLYNWKNVGIPGEVAIQAFTRGNRSHQFGNAGADNATPIAEMRFTLTCDLGTIDFPPAIEDAFKTMHVETQYPPGSDPKEIQQTKVQYDIPQN
jgi:hypothetical protein